MKRTSIYALILLAVCSCAPKEAGPAVFEISPKSLSGESYTAHSTKVTVRCDMDCTARLKQGTWLKVSFDKDQSNTATATLTFSFNDSFAQRKDTLEIKCSTESRTIPIVQNSMSIPGGAFTSSIPGMYLPGGSSFRYEKYSFQKGGIENRSSKAYRLFETETRRLFQLSNLPFSYTPGEKIRFVRYQNAISTMPETSDITATILRTESGVVWLVEDNGCGYIIEK